LPVPGLRTSLYGLIETRAGSIIAATHDGIFRTLDDGVTWRHVGVQRGNIKILEAERGRAFAIGEGGSVWSSADAGDSWVRLPSPSVPIDDRVRGSVQLSGIVVPGDGRVFGLTAQSLLVSHDAAQTWAVSGLSKGAQSVVRLGDTWFAGGSSGVFKSQNLTTWVECSAGIQHPSIQSLTATSTGDLLALTYMGIFRSLDRCGSWWLLAELPRSDVPWRIIAIGPDVGIVLAGRGIAQWSFVERKWTTNPTAPEITAVAHDGAGAHWTGTADGVYQFVPRAGSWELQRAGLQGQHVTALTFHPDGYLLAGVAGSDTFRARLR
jgi:ligand-binding sensor domain-containing protein